METSTQTDVFDSSERILTQDANDIQLGLMGVAPEETEFVKCEGNNGESFSTGTKA